MRAFSSAVASVASSSAASLKPNPILQYFLDLPSQNALTESFPGVPRSTNTVATPPSVVAVTKLGNGLTVVSQDSHGAVASVGLTFKAGSRYEKVAGTSHLLEHAAFSGTNHRSTLKLHKDAEDMGGSFRASTSREEFVLSADVLRESVESMVELLAEVALEPKLRPWTVEELKHAEFEDAVEGKAASNHTLLIEGLYAAAYGGEAGMGRRQWAEEGDLEHLSSDTLLEHMKAHFTGSTGVLTAVNVPHAVLVDLAKKYLGGLPPSTTTPTPTAPTWKGGETLLRSVRGAGSASVALGLPAPSLAATPKTAAAASVLAAVLGGSPPRSPFKPGFPGTSRLAVSSRSLGAQCRAFYLPSTDSGLLGVMGSLPVSGEAGEAGEVKALLASLVVALKGAAGTAVTGDELKAAKAQAKLRLAASQEGREGQMLAFGGGALRGVASPDTLLGNLEAIESVSSSDVAAVAKQALSAPPAVVAISSLEGFPRYEQIAAMLK